MAIIAAGWDIFRRKLDGQRIRWWRYIVSRVLPHVSFVTALDAPL